MVFYLSRKSRKIILSRICGKMFSFGLMWGGRQVKHKKTRPKMDSMRNDVRLTCGNCSYWHPDRFSKIRPVWGVCGSPGGVHRSKWTYGCDDFQRPMVCTEGVFIEGLFVFYNK